MESFVRSAVPDIRRRGPLDGIGGILREFLVAYGLAITGLLPDLTRDPAEATDQDSGSTSAKRMRVR